MTTLINSKQRAILTIAAVLVIVVLFWLLGRWQIPKEALFPILAYITLANLVLTTMLYISSMMRSWKQLSQPRRIFLRANGVVLILAFAGAGYFFWPFLPWGQAGAFQVANEFMTDLHNANYSAALEKLTPVTKKHIDSSSMDQPDAQPVTWELTHIDSASTVTGKASFTDGTELPVKIKMRWLRGQWQINGVTFGEWITNPDGSITRTTRIDFLMCCDSWW